VIRAADPETSAHYLGGIPHTAGLPQGRWNTIFPPETFGGWPAALAEIDPTH
jgi:hypothetical protein